ncbi:unnamed protein product, partial [Staurois parvus]
MIPYCRGGPHELSVRPWHGSILLSSSFRAIAASWSSRVPSYG